MTTFRLRARRAPCNRAFRPTRAYHRNSTTSEDANSATEIKDTVGRVTLYRFEECRVILADIVIPRTVPEGSGEPIVKRDRRLAEAADLFRITWFLGAAHQSACLSRALLSLIHHRSSALELLSGIGPCEGEAIAAQAFRENLEHSRIGWNR